MGDFLTKAKRSALLAAIRSHEKKKTELALIKILRLQGLTVGRRRQKLLGSADFLKDRKLVVFVQGCFWHGCPNHSTHAITSGPYWSNKLAMNQSRDRRLRGAIRQMGWRVVRVWEHELLQKNEDRLLQRLRRALVF